MATVTGVSLSASVRTTSRAAQMSGFCTLCAATSALSSATVAALTGTTSFRLKRALMIMRAISLLTSCERATAGSTLACRLPSTTDSLTICALLLASLMRLPTTAHGSAARLSE